MSSVKTQCEDADGIIRDPVEDTFEGTGDLDVSTLDDLEALSQEEAKCQESMYAYETLLTYTADRTTLSFFEKRGLISSSSYGALESVLDPVSLTQAALEAVVEEASETSKSWAGKAVQLVGNFIKKCGALIHGIVEKVSHATGKVKETAKAHPYATAASVIAAVTLTTAAVIATRGALSPAVLKNAAQMNTEGGKIASLFSRIKTVFSKADVVYKDGKFTETLKITGETTKTAAKDGGWNSVSAKATQSAFTRAMTSLWAALKSFGSMVVSAMQSIWKAAKPHIKTAAHKVDSVAAGAIDRGNKIASSDHNFLVKMAAGMFVFTFVKSLVTLVIKMVHWVIGMARAIVAKTVIAICGEEESDPTKDEDDEILK